MIITVVGRKGSPGITTLTALLAAYWDEPHVTRVIIEADSSGGTLAARWSGVHNLSWDPGLLALSAMRGVIDADALVGVTQPLGEQLHIACAPPASHQVEAALSALGDAGAAALAQAADVRAFVDCGRLGSRSAAMPLAKRAAMTVVVCRNTLEEIHTLLPAVAELRDEGCQLGLVVMVEPSGGYHATEIAERAEIDLLGVLPTDERAAAAFARDGIHADRKFQRSGLAVRAAELASLVQARCVTASKPFEPAAAGVAEDGLPGHGPSAEVGPMGAVPVGAVPLGGVPFESARPVAGPVGFVISPAPDHDPDATDSSGQLVAGSADGSVGAESGSG